LQLFLNRNWTSQIVGSLESLVEHAMVLTILFWQNNESTLLSLTGLGKGEKSLEENKNNQHQSFFCQNIDFVSVSRNNKILKNIFVVQIILVQLFLNFLPSYTLSHMKLQFYFLDKLIWYLMFVFTISLKWKTYLICGS
jgi:hypothetical protein